MVEENVLGELSLPIIDLYSLARKALNESPSHLCYLCTSSILSTLACKMIEKQVK